MGENKNAFDTLNRPCPTLQSEVIMTGERKNGEEIQHENRAGRWDGAKETLSKIRKCILTKEKNMLDNQTPGG